MRIPALLLALTVPALGAPPVIDDARLARTFQRELASRADAGDCPSGKELAAALGKAPRRAGLELPECAAPASYGEVVKSVVLLGSVYKCGKCDNWHLGGVATAWCLTADGVFATNHHCFTQAEGAVHGVCTIDGRVFPVREILAGDPQADVCLFRVEGDGFTPLPLGEPAEVGSRVRVISHPERRFYLQTGGEVARYYRRPGRGDRPGSVWMAITADYAKGSSGGPVLDGRGAVVGMASSTQSIYYGSRANRRESDSGEGSRNEGPLQMVVKNCVPVAAIAEIAGAATPEAQGRPGEPAAPGSRQAARRLR